jgi:hypothetical protein
LKCTVTATTALRSAKTMRHISAGSDLRKERIGRKGIVAMRIGKIKQ